MRKGVTVPKRDYERYERLGGNRPGRNICISGRITDSQDERIDDIANEKNITRSKIISNAVTRYLKEAENKNTTSGIFGDHSVVTSSNTGAGNMNSTQLTIIIERDEDGMYIAIIPSLEGCYSYGKTLDEVLVNLQKAINTDLPPL